MQSMDRYRARAKMLVAATASAVLLSAVAVPAAADGVKWKTIIGIIQAGNVVGNIPGGGQPWSTLGGFQLWDRR